MKKSASYFLSAATIVAALLLLLGVHAHVNVAAAGLILVTVVTICSVLWGSGPGLIAALIGVTGLNYFFIPPVHTFAIAGTENWVAFIVFACCALVVGQLSARAQDRLGQLEEEQARAKVLHENLQAALREATNAELLRRSESLKSALLDAVTHDIRTPLTSIKASVTALLADDGKLAHADPESSKELLQVIDEETDRLNRFTEQMVELAKLQSHQLVVQPEPSSVQEIVEAAASCLEDRLRERTLEISIGETASHVRADAKLISEVMYNILDNAVKYSPVGSRIVVSTTPDGSSSTVFRVEDEGPGIATDLRGQVFQRFFRAPSSQRAVGGLGMGLAIAQGIVQAHGGKIWIEDARSHRGAAVCFTVPAAVGEQHD
ncbi:MAG: ATP-binding protein [Terriglobales bacterium]|jgi:K+-sensing histidine kinase KdpD